MLETKVNINKTQYPSQYLLPRGKAGHSVSITKNAE